MSDTSFKGLNIECIMIDDIHVELEMMDVSKIVSVDVARNPCIKNETILSYN